jgi:putative methionine-R-sulfoxide reductase with GAF domain
MSKKHYTFTLHHGSALSESEMIEIATQICNVAVERRMGFTVEEVTNHTSPIGRSTRRLTYSEIWGED